MHLRPLPQDVTVDFEWPGGVSVASDIDGVLIVATVSGQWEVRLSADVHNEVHKALTGRPRLLMLDARNLVDPTAASASAWMSVSRIARDWQPSVRLALCLSSDTILAHRLNQLDPKRIPLFPSPAAARAALSACLVLTEHLQQHLPPKAKSVSIARRLVAEACRSWRLRSVSSVAQLVVSELVTNAVEHTGTNMVVTVSRRGRGIFLAVRDGGATLPPLDPAPAAPTADRGRGLRIVRATAIAWGALPSHDGSGKVVWAEVKARRRENE
jgi:anti-sigma regulatory factor (Ser/Thr protein kinase)